MNAVTHALTCPVRSRWQHWRLRMPFWRDDKVAIMLNVAHKGCWRCGRGATLPYQPRVDTPVHLRPRGTVEGFLAAESLRKRFRP